MSIRQSTTPVMRERESPAIRRPALANPTAGDAILLSGSQQNEHNLIPFIGVEGIGEAVSDYLESELDGPGQQLDERMAQAESCSGCGASALAAFVAGREGPLAVVRAGHLNLDQSATFGSPDQPVYLIVDGINTNQPLTLTVYGTLVVTGGLNANNLHEGLAAASEHQYRVRAVNGAVAGDWSPYILIYTLPAAPGHLQAAAAGSTRIELSWDPVPGAIL
ncbi:hypothetical protein IDH44_10130 [Paenibacillus sp. IB182496]|uniref:Fibronectin type-III domain-containing protein n=1 Tax=Paenibacillus sabuli TaxID=2772509 RepID=A0A927BRQ6_9BACL|nr:hypothetical protein [Paenibacillus sabuli]MBD2845547.1 hypothetical protein [Paenibacillus sabuli]